jgi:hypothetical protein
LTGAILIRPRRLETPASADRRHDQVKRRVHRVTAFLNEIVRRLLRRADLHELGLFLLSVLAEVGAQPALAVVYLKHVVLRIR